jgi:anaerobic magnesium-protoporphyrin IX monomethyl ester cyclase
MILKWNKNMKSIDCLFIGHNEMDFCEFEESIRKMGVNSGAYRDLNLNFIWFDNKPYTAAETYNSVVDAAGPRSPVVPPLNILSALSPTIAYLGTWLDRRGFTFDYVNSFQDEKDRLIEKLQKMNILAIAVTTTLYTSVFPIIGIMQLIKQYNNEAKIIIGGPYVATQARTQGPKALDYLFHSIIGADFYVNSSQGEATLVKILYALKTGTPVEQVPNIYYRTPQKCVATHLEKENNPLSENMVNWNLFGPRLGDHVAVRTSISCPFSCSFCNFPQYAGQYQPVTVEAIERELNLLSEIDSVTTLHFIDDTLNVPVQRYKEILRMMIRNKYSFHWHAYFRCQFADREMVELMKESGCQLVYLGLESGSNRILKNMNKAASIEDYRKGIALLKEYQLITHGNFILGFPGETNETVSETVKFINESSIDFFRIQLWYCLHLTPIWMQREEFKIVGESFEWKHATMNSKTAADLIDEVFLSIEDPVWLPQYHFDVVNLWHLLQRGITINQVKKFLKAFNKGIKEKLFHPSQRGVSKEVIEQIKNVCEVAP